MTAARLFPVETIKNKIYTLLRQKGGYLDYL